MTSTIHPTRTLARAASRRASTTPSRTGATR